MHIKQIRRYHLTYCRKQNSCDTNDLTINTVMFLSCILEKGNILECEKETNKLY